MDQPWAKAESVNDSVNTFGRLYLSGKKLLCRSKLLPEKSGVRICSGAALKTPRSV